MCSSASFFFIPRFSPTNPPFYETTEYDLFNNPCRNQILHRWVASISIQSQWEIPDSALAKHNRFHKSTHNFKNSNLNSCTTVKKEIYCLHGGRYSINRFQILQALRNAALELCYNWTQGYENLQFRSGRWQQRTSLIPPQLLITSQPYSDQTSLQPKACSKVGLKM